MYNHNHNPVEKTPTLWRRLEEAKLQLDVAHSNLEETPAVDRAALLREASKQYLRAADHMEAALKATDTVDAPITEREQQVLALIAASKSNKEIAKELGIAYGTAAFYRYRLQTKLHAHNTAQLMQAARKMGLIELDS